MSIEILKNKFLKTVVVVFFISGIAQTFKSSAQQMF